MLWGAFFLVLGPLRSAGDGDLYWQRWLGDVLLQSHHLPLALGSETVTAAGATWVPQEWFFSLLVAMAASMHLTALLSMLMSALPLGILVTIYLRGRNLADPVSIGIVILLCGIAMLQSFGVRAQVLGWSALAVFMLFIERRDRWYYAAIPITIVWANLHASVALAPVIVVARIAAAFAGGGIRSLRGNRDVVMLPAVLLAMLCTPLGWRLPFYAVALAGSPIRHFIEEWQPTRFSDMSFTLGALPLALAIVAGGATTLLRHKVMAVPAAVLFAAMLFAGRNIALFAIVAAPLAAIGLDVRLPRLRELSARIAELEPVASACILVAAVLSGVALVRMERAAPPILPVAAITSLEDGAQHRIFCENFTWCSIALGNPGLRVFMDGRCDPYPLAVWRQYIAAITLKPSWTAPLQTYGIDSVVARRGSRFAIALTHDVAWRQTFADRAYVVFRRE